MAGNRSTGRRRYEKTPSTTSAVITIVVKTGRLIARALRPEAEDSAMLLLLRLGHGGAVREFGAGGHDDAVPCLESRRDGNHSRVVVANARRHDAAAHRVALEHEHVLVRRALAYGRWGHDHRASGGADANAAARELPGHHPPVGIRQAHVDSDLPGGRIGHRVNPRDGARESLARRGVDRKRHALP